MDSGSKSPLCDKCGGEMLPGHYLSSYYTRDENGNVNQRLEGHLFCSSPFMNHLETFID